MRLFKDDFRTVAVAWVVVAVAFLLLWPAWLLAKFLAAVVGAFRWVTR